MRICSCMGPNIWILWPASIWFFATLPWEIKPLGWYVKRQRDLFWPHHSWRVRLCKFMCMLHSTVSHLPVIAWPTKYGSLWFDMHALAWNLKLMVQLDFKSLLFSLGWDVSKDKMKSGFLKLLNIEQVGLEDFDEEEEIELGQTEEQHFVVIFGLVSCRVPSVEMSRIIQWHGSAILYYIYIYTWRIFTIESTMRSSGKVTGFRGVSKMELAFFDLL